MFNDFFTRLQQLRKAANLTNEELGRRADVPDTLIAALQNSKRRIGELQARKLGTALKLEGEALEQFVYEAINNCTEKLLNASKGYPAELLNLLALQLRSSGILPESIYRCSVHGGRVDLTLVSGSKAVLTAQLEYS